MPRTARCLKKGACYYIHAEGYQKKIIFQHDLDYKKYLRLLRKYRLRFRVSVYAFTLLPQSAHLLIDPQDEKQIANFMRGLQQSYATHFNDRRSFRGKVWKERYSSSVINKGRELIEYIKWLEFMPVESSLVTIPISYPYSSCSLRIQGSQWYIDSIPRAVWSQVGGF